MEDASRKRTGGGRPGRGVTLADVARALQVSKATVSNAYNRPDQLSAHLRERVLSEAARLGYPGPDPIAATFSRRRAGAIGLVFDDPLTFALSDPAEALFVTGLGEVCEQAGAGLVLIPRGSSDELVRRAVVDGFVLHCDLDGDTRVDTALTRDVPVVIVDGPPRPRPGSESRGRSGSDGGGSGDGGSSGGSPGGGGSGGGGGGGSGSGGGRGDADGIAPRAAGHVGVDDRAAAATAARHLIDIGHRSIAVLALPLVVDGGFGPADAARQAAAQSHVIRERLAGYRDVLAAAGIDWATVPVIECGPYSREAGYRAAGLVLDRPDRPTALLAASDELALGALRAAADRGITVPGQLAVVGFDDAPPAAWSSPPLTTVRQPHREKGRVAASQLLGGGPLTDVVLPTELILRGST